MNSEQSTTLSLISAYAFGIARGLEAEVNAIRSMVIEWDSTYTSSLRRGYIIELFEKQGVFQDFKAKHWTFGDSPDGEKKRLRFLRIKKRYEDFLAGRIAEANDDSENTEGEQRFAAESDLRDFLAKNPTCIEQGLCLFQNGQQVGVEFPIDDGYIDLLAVDRDGKFVVIELKVGRGRNKTVGQLLYYMGWVDSHLGNSPCRGMIIAKENSDDLILAVQRVPGVSLYKYSLSVSVEAVSAIQ